jgi:hypothetical protein
MNPIIALLFTLLLSAQVVAQQSGFNGMESYSAVSAQLNSILQADQSLRAQSDAVEQQFGSNSAQYKSLWQRIGKADSANLAEVKHILSVYGWLGAKEVGPRANMALFLVIQHADSATRAQYLPALRKAVTEGKAFPDQLALLEDRLALEQGRKQIYGSQIYRDAKTKVYYVAPLEDPDHVNERRAKVGLEPLQQYVRQWGMSWDLEQYKKDLPKIEEGF